jgi:multiple sugar transport system permease protein
MTAARRIPPGLVWVAPALLVLAVLGIYPLLYLIKLSLTDVHGMTFAHFTIAHYARLFHDRLFGVAVGQTLLYASVALTLEFLLGLALALLVDSLARGRALIRVGILAPMLLPPVVAAVIWRLIYNPEFGVLNGMLRQLGFNTANLTWTSGRITAMLSVILVDVWEWTPFFFLLLSAGLQAIPAEPVEAARVDGAGYWRTLLDVILPLLKPVILLALLLRSMDLLRIFDQIFILTQGGPGSATETLSLYIYRTAFRFSDFGYAAAMSFIALMITMLAARGLMRLMKTEREGNAS